VHTDTPGAAEALRQFRVIFGSVRQHFQAVEKACGVSGAQIWALAVLRDKPGLKVSELARDMSIRASTASNLLDKVEKAGLIRRERNSEDQRVVRLYLTDDGADRLAAAPQPITGLLTHALSKLDPSVLTRLNQDLATLIAHLDEVDQQAGQSPISGL